MINEFRLKYYFLSNFYNAPVTYKGITYLNNEAAFQAMKVLTDKERVEFAQLQPNKAKRLGRKVKLRTGWDEIKDSFMYEICLEKFIQNSDLREELIDTGYQELIEGNTWYDYYWGVCNGRGKNKLGQILMRVRDELR